MISGISDLKRQAEFEAMFILDDITPKPTQEISVSPAQEENSATGTEPQGKVEDKPSEDTVVDP